MHLYLLQQDTCSKRSIPIVTAVNGTITRLRPAAETDMLPCGDGRGENAEFGSSAASGELAFRLHCRTASAVSLVGYSRPTQLYSKISVGRRDSKGQDNETRLQSAYDYTQTAKLYVDLTLKIH